MGTIMAIILLIILFFIIGFLKLVKKTYKSFSPLMEIIGLFAAFASIFFFDEIISPFAREIAILGQSGIFLPLDFSTIPLGKGLIIAGICLGVAITICIVFKKWKFIATAIVSASAFGVAVIETYLMEFVINFFVNASKTYANPTAACVRLALIFVLFTAFNMFIRLRLYSVLTYKCVGVWNIIIAAVMFGFATFLPLRVIYVMVDVSFTFASLFLPCIAVAGISFGIMLLILNKKTNKDKIKKIL